MDFTFTLTLVRHAKTQGNVERKYVGWTDEGIIESELPIIDSTVQIVYGSDLKRCEQTAKQYYPHATFHRIPAFRETNFGDFEMKTYEDLKEDEVYRAWIDDPLQVAPPNGESFQTFQQRVEMGISEITEAEKCAMVLHGGTIRILLMKYAPTPTVFWDWSISHDEMYELTFTSFQDFKEGKRCISLSVAHITEKENT